MKIMQLLSILFSFILIIGSGAGIYKNTQDRNIMENNKKQVCEHIQEAAAEEETQESTTEETAVTPTTVAPTTVAPTTAAPTTAAPTTIAPTTAAPATVAPTTVAPTTAAPTTAAPTTAAPTTPAPTTKAATAVIVVPDTTASYSEAHLTGYTEDRTYINEELSQLFKQRLLQNINDERVRCGVGTVKDDIYLDSACVIRSQEIVTCWSHTRPNGERGMYVVASCGGIYQDMVYRLQNNLPSTYALGENLAYCDMWNRDDSITFDVSELDYTVTDSQTMQAVIKMADWIFEDWKISSSHYANMIHASYTNAGLGLTVGLAENGLKRFYVASLYYNS